MCRQIYSTQFGSRLRGELWEFFGGGRILPPKNAWNNIFFDGVVLVDCSRPTSTAYNSTTVSPIGLRSPITGPYKVVRCKSLCVVVMMLRWLVLEIVLWYLLTSLGDAAITRMFCPSLVRGSGWRMGGRGTERLVQSQLPPLMLRLLLRWWTRQSPTEIRVRRPHSGVTRGAVITSLRTASYVRCKRDTARVCCWAPCCCPRCGAAAGGHPAPDAVDRHFSPARRSAANSPNAAAAGEWLDGRTDRQTHGRTPDSSIDHAPRTRRAVSITVCAANLPHQE